MSETGACSGIGRFGFIDGACQSATFRVVARRGSKRAENGKVAIGRLSQFSQRLGQRCTLGVALIGVLEFAHAFCYRFGVVGKKLRAIERRELAPLSLLPLGLLFRLLSGFLIRL